MKCNPKDRLPEIIGSLELILTNFMSEIRSSFDYYEAQSNMPVEKIFLSGGGSLYVGLKEYFSRLLGIPLFDCNLISAVTKGANLDSDTLNQQAPFLNVACGLALR